MKGCIFRLGKIDKKIIWPFLFALNQIVLNLINKLFPKEQKNQIIDNFSLSLGTMLVLIIPFFFKSKEKIIKKDEICTKNNIKYQAIYWFICLIFYLTVYLSTFLGSGIVVSTHNSLLVTKEAVEIIIIIIITMIFFKSKYYIHHIISLVIFCGLCCGIDFLLDNYKEEFSQQVPLKIIFNIVIIVSEIIRFCYQKYMMNTLYYHYWTVSFSLGLFLSLLSLSILICAYIFGDKNDEKNKFYSYFKFLENAEFKYTFPRVITWIIIYALKNLLQLLTLESLTISHMMISYEIGKIENILRSSKSDKKWYSIILFLFQFISLLFFLEIFEFNFCNLNKNTKRNIEERSLDTMNMRESMNTTSEVNIEGYAIQETNSENSNEMQILNNDKENTKQILNNDKENNNEIN